MFYPLGFEGISCNSVPIAEANRSTPFYKDFYQFCFLFTRVILYLDDSKWYFWIDYNKLLIKHLVNSMFKQHLVELIMYTLLIL